MPPLNLRTISLQFSRSYRTARGTRRARGVAAQESKPSARAQRPAQAQKQRDALGSAQERVSKSQQERFTVNYFDQDVGPNSERRPMEFDMDKTEEEELDNKMKQLEDDIESFEMPADMPDNLARLFLSDGEREAAGQAFQEELTKLQINGKTVNVNGEEVQQLRLDDAYMEPYHVVANIVIPRQYQLLLNRLNDALNDSKMDLKDDIARKAVSRWYSHCKHKVRSFLHMIPDEAWDLIWAVQSQDDLSNPNRVALLKSLAEDMLLAGRDLTLVQRLAMIEGTFLAGEEQDAFDQWEKQMTASKRPEAELMELGVRMFARSGHLERAEQVLNDLFAVKSSYDPRVILAVIVAHNDLKTPEHFAQAWSLYITLRERLSTDITIEDYDQVSLSFLHNGRRDLALAVFRDMMLSGDDASDTYWKKSVDIIRQIISKSNKVKQVNDASLTALTYLPIRFQNKYFYASWLKRLIGMGQIDAAAQVVELMYERGFPPDAKHVNGLVSAWFRQGNPAARQKAESMAWAMIQARLNFVARRDERVQLRKNGAVEEKTPSSIHRNGVRIPPIFATRPVPAATIETFSILVQHYVHRNRQDHVRHLRDLLVDARIPMNSYFMNHILVGLLQSGDPRGIWPRYQVLSRTVTPDMSTFSCLWEAVKLDHDPSRNVHAHAPSVPHPRALFANMTSYLASLPPAAAAAAAADLPRQTYHTALHAFVTARPADLAGCLLAAHALAAPPFALRPNPHTLRMLVLALAQLPLNAVMPAPRRPAERRAQNASAAARAEVARMTGVLDAVLARRAAALQGGLEALGEQGRIEEVQRAMLELLYVVLREEVGEHEAVVEVLGRVAEEMGLQRLDLDEALAPVVEDGV